MIPIRRLGLAAAFAAAILSIVACGMTPEPEDGPPKPATVDFKGTAEPAYAGLWSTAEGFSVLDLGKDGSLDLTTINVTPGGKVKKDLKGSWLVDGDRLLLKYSDKAGMESVIAYRSQLDGNNLTLTTKSPKLETKYTRK